jgi:hypothetical protein
MAEAARVHDAAHNYAAMTTITPNGVHHSAYMYHQGVQGSGSRPRKGYFRLYSSLSAAYPQ